MKKYLKHLLILAAVIAVCTILNPTKAQAEAQGRSAYANGYREKKK